MIQEEVESQLSAMFDGELPTAECELLSRRIDRDPELRARWSRYAVVGAVMRAEPVSAVSGGFSRRVSAVLDAQADGAGRAPASPGRTAQRRTWWNATLAASLVTMVAGASILMLRDVSSVTVPQVAAVRSAAQSSPDPAVAGASMVASTPASDEPPSYVTPTMHGAPHFGLATQLADYVVAHSEYSTPLVRRNLLSALVTGEEPTSGSDAAGEAGTDEADNVQTAAPAPHGSR